MIQKTYKYSAKCDICAKEETFETEEENFWPDDWFELRNNGKPVALFNEEGRRVPVTVQPFHFCRDCFESLFGIGGSAWETVIDADTDEDVEAFIGLTD